MKLAQAEVYLIGAGPGDPGLITVKGLERLRDADIVFYDNLVHPDLLRKARPDAELVPVGKKGGGESVSQDNIHRLLLAAAKKGLKVARLKGGDPYLFGRGAEEGVFLAKHGVRFEVLPGITSGMACATYAGIPLTERHLSSSVTFLTGHSHKAGNSGLPQHDWKALARGSNTLVIYMGVAKIRDITRQLIDNGLSASTPAAVVQWGTWTRQKSCVATLSGLPARVRAQKISSPAVLIVGRVVRLHKTLSSFEKLPLFGKKIVVTRAERQSAPLRRDFERLGAQVLDIPAISIQRPKDFAPMDAALRRLSTFDWVVLTSANGVESLFDRLDALDMDARALAGCRVAAVGTATRERLMERGVRADFMPRTFTAEDLSLELTAAVGSLAGKRFLFLRSQIAPQAPVDRLKEHGAEVTQVTAYQTLRPTTELRAAFARALAEKPDILTFTSSSTVHNLVASVRPADLRALLKGARVLSIGPVTTEALRSHGIRVHREAAVHTTTGLVAAAVALNRRTHAQNK